jgi:hypothetical protein
MTTMLCTGTRPYGRTAITLSRPTVSLSRQTNRTARPRRCNRSLAVSAGRPIRRDALTRTELGLVAAIALGPLPPDLSAPRIATAAKATAMVAQVRMATLLLRFFASCPCGMTGGDGTERAARGCIADLTGSRAGFGAEATRSVVLDGLSWVRSAAARRAMAAAPPASWAGWPAERSATNLSTDAGIRPRNLATSRRESRPATQSRASAPSARMSPFIALDSAGQAPLNPKSFTAPSSRSRIFSGLMSPCARSARWTASSAAASRAMTSTARIASSGPLAKASLRGWPTTYSITRYGGSAGSGESGSQ